MFKQFQKALVFGFAIYLATFANAHAGLGKKQKKSEIMRALPGGAINYHFEIQGNLTILYPIFPVASGNDFVFIEPEKPEAKVKSDEQQALLYEKIHYRKRDYDFVVVPGPTGSGSYYFKAQKTEEEYHLLSVPVEGPIFYMEVMDDQLKALVIPSANFDMTMAYFKAKIPEAALNQAIYTMMYIYKNPKLLSTTRN